MELKYQVYRVIDHLQNKEAVTCRDLAEELGMALKTAQRHLRELHAQDLVYVAAWDREYHQPIPVYKWAVVETIKTDAPKPKAMTAAEAAKRRRKRAKEASCQPEVTTTVTFRS